MNTVSLNNLWTYLQGLSLTKGNKKWLAEHLYEAVESETKAKKDLTEEYSLAQLDMLQKARALTEEQMHVMRQQEHISPEELRILLYRTVDDIYRQP